jgi:hypothetical protein
LLEAIKQLSQYCSGSVDVLVKISEDLIENQQKSEAKQDKASYLIRSCHNLRRDFVQMTATFKSQIEEVAKSESKLFESKTKYDLIICKN